MRGGMEAVYAIEGAASNRVECLTTSALLLGSSHLGLEPGNG
jgi:hypothetical protein